MDAWMTRPGARVEGHAAKVESAATELHVACSCGYQSLALREQAHASLLLTMHLQQSVRRGAAVIDGDDGLSGVREPRRPVSPTGQLTAERDLD